MSANSEGCPYSVSASAGCDQSVYCNPWVLLDTHGDTDVDRVAVEVTVGWGSRIAPSTVRELVPVVRPRQVRLDPVGPGRQRNPAIIKRYTPEDRADGLAAAVRGQARSPGERLDLLNLALKAEFLKKHLCALFEVECVDMQALDACFLVGEDGAAHVADKLGADLADFLVVALNGTKGVVRSAAGRQSFRA